MIKEILVGADKVESLYTSLVVVAGSTLLVYLIIYPLYFHPLAQIPGPPICALTKYFILYKSWHEERNRYVQTLHEKYGSIVRVGPNEVDINDATYLKDIYVGNYDKSSFYSQFVNYNESNTFSITTKKEHISSRKVSHKFYSKSNICSENVMSRIETVMHDTLVAFDRHQNRPLNVFVLFCDMAMDAVTSFSFGRGNYESLLADPFGRGKQIVTDFGLQSLPWFWVTQMPTFYDFVVSKKVVEASNRCYKWIEKQYLTAFERLQLTQTKTEETLLTVYFTCETASGEAEQKSPIFTKDRTKSEFFDHIAAGHITTGTTLSYLFYELARFPEVQKKVQQELLQNLNNGQPADASDHNSIKYAAIDDEQRFPYFHALLFETFRVHAAIPGQEPRVVPQKGLLFRGNATTPACKIPKDTVVVMQPWSLHRVRQLFPHPDRFDPQRWIDADPQQLKAMKANMMHFGAGTRMCIGLHLATAEIKIIVASLLCRYNVQLVDGFDYDYDGGMLDIYTTLPRSENMELRFTPLAQPS